MSNNLNKNLTAGAPEGVDPDVLSGLLAVAAKKLGCTPDELRRNLENGKIEQAIKNADASKNPQLQKLKAAVNDPAAAEKLVKSSGAEQILKKLKK
jgi:hypothetical protein